MKSLLNPTRARNYLATKGIDILIGDGFVNFGYLTGYFSHFMADYPGPLYDGQPLVRFAGLPADPGLEPFLITYPGERGDMEVQGAWIQERIFYGPTYNFGAGVTLPADPVACLAGALQERGLARSRLGLDAQNLSAPLMGRIRDALPGATLIDAHADFLALRMLKTPEEISRLRLAAKAVERGHVAVRENLREGITSAEMSALIKRATLDEESDRYIVHVGFGKQGALHVAPHDNRLKKGDVVTADIAAIHKFYMGDITRVYSFGPPAAETVRIHQVLDEVNATLLDAIKPGVAASELYRLATKVLAERNLSLALNLAGHGLGLDVHEPPYLTPKDHTILQPDMVLNTEITLKIPDLGYFSVEITCLITSSGYELLTSIPHTLTVVE